MSYLLSLSVPPILHSLSFSIFLPSAFASYSLMPCAISILCTIYYNIAYFSTIVHLHTLSRTIRPGQARLHSTTPLLSLRELHWCLMMLLDLQISLFQCIYQQLFVNFWTLISMCKKIVTSDSWYVWICQAFSYLAEVEKPGKLQEMHCRLSNMTIVKILFRVATVVPMRTTV